MLLEHRGRRPVVPESAYVAPSAVLCGAVVLGEGSRVLHGAVLTAENGEVRLGENSVVMENALVRGRANHPALIGDAPPLPSQYAKIIIKHLGGLGAELVLEPGRLIVGNAGILVTTVEYVKEGDKTFVIVDAAMNDLIRPTLYEAFHEIEPVRHSNLPQITADVVGPVCETGDYIALGRKMEGVKQGDLLAVMSAGAYGAVMASTYNSRPLVPEVLVDGDRWHVIRPRKSIAELIALDSVPEWV